MRTAAVVIVTAILVLGAAGMVLAAPETAEQRPANPNAGLLGLAAAIAVGFGAIGTAWAQSRIGAAAAGAMAERPEIGGLMLVFLALPETMIILGFLVAFFVISRI
ncbi:MAG: F0F1 ATP synthase subunit C [Armatimonadota bacterium]|nr:F0F1 ATP synthase subunit C [Armatimonadota bacterium]MDR7401863.1 F0F1 ATP synthase subunit C [Armatimonadota bacterium]MDR7403907.1 F0F1 ATP synthase subunit C [Armatimonadota bacterium]MDR7437421.1 F0F1 ATP synthase subunit C [Armatimonadota bacterium]MDR7473172.1 F0F1 ATP synthase subunit C [Armatimonadota bacterium]